MLSKKVVHCCSAQMDAAQVATVEMNMMVRMMDYLSSARLEEMSADVKMQEICCWLAASKMDEMTAKMKMKGVLLGASLAEVMVEMKADLMDFLFGAS